MSAQKSKSALSGKSAQGRIVRALGVFSGVRVVNILCSLIRNKLIATFIGPAGMGLVVLYNSVIELVAQSTRLSIDQSAQRDISQSSSEQSHLTIAVVRRWALWLGLAGSLIMCALSPLLSLWSFETTDRWQIFCLLSVVPFCLTYNASVTAQNQGLRRFKALASSSLLGAFLGLAAAVPLILWLGIDSIVWIIVAYGVSTFLGGLLFHPRISRIKVPMREVVERGRSFIKLGVQITAAWTVAQLANYLFILYLNTFASTDTLGIYQAGYTLTNSYIGIVFAALFVEYYPRVSASAHSPRRLALAASHEVRLTLTILAPLLCLLIVLVNPVIRLIYADSFLQVAPYIVVACVGVVFRVTSWCLAYVILARGDGRAYLFTDICSSVVGLAANIAGYEAGGYVGLGVAYIVWYAIYTLLVGAVCRRRYGVRLSKNTFTYIGASLTAIGSLALLYLYFMA